MYVPEPEDYDNFARGSSLLDDLLMLTHHSGYVEKVFTPSFPIAYEVDGHRRYYTPDAFIRYRHDRYSDSGRRPTLYAVHYRAELRRDWQRLRPGFVAALRYAASQGWEFRIVTERELRIPALTTARFLKGFWAVNAGVKQVIQQAMTETLAQEGSLTVAQLLQRAARTGEAPTELVKSLWHLVSCGVIECGVAGSLSLSSDLWYMGRQERAEHTQARRQLLRLRTRIPDAQADVAAETQLPGLPLGQEAWAACLPGVLGTIGPHGVIIDHLCYSDKVLNPWMSIGEFERTGPNRHLRPQRFLFRRDPRDIRYVYFLNPKTGSYRRVRCATAGRPPITLGQWERAYAQVLLAGDIPDEERLFQQIAAMTPEKGSGEEKRSKKIVAAVGKK